MYVCMQFCNMTKHFSFHFYGIQKSLSITTTVQVALCIQLQMVPSIGWTHANDVDVALEWSLGSKGTLMTSVSLLFNSESKDSVYNWLIRVNHCSFSTDTVSQPSPHASSYNTYNSYNVCTLMYIATYVRMYI